MKQTNTSSVPSDNTQSLHLLMTKCFRPAVRPNLIRRQQLTAQLDAAVDQGHKLILISAPAGFGKTTLLIDWLAGPDAPIAAWFALDDQDNHLGQFLAYLIGSLETVRPGIGTEAWALLRAHVAYPPVHAILTTLLNALVSNPTPTILILDDYHIITLQAIHEAVAFLLDHMPAHMHVILTTRADPSLPLARLRVRGQLTEIRAADLRFTTTEATDLFGQIKGIDLAPAAVQTLENRTEGWIAGLQLAALALQQHAAHIPSFLADFTGSHHYVFDYLAEEVFQQQPQAIQLFLLQTSILTRLCGPLSDALTGQRDGQAMLEHLDQSNLFLIRLDSNRRWYRYHHLFGDFLRERLDRMSGATGHIVLHQRASAWFEQHGLIGEAVDHALKAQAWGTAIRCLTPIMASDTFYGYYLEWPRWLAALPDTVLLAEPGFCLRLSWILALSGHAEAVQRPLALAEAAWQSANNQAQIGAVLVCRSLVIGYQGDALQASKLAEQALTMLAAEMTEQRAMAIWLLGNSQVALGHPENIIDMLSTAHRIFTDLGASFYAQASGLLTARAYQLQGKLQQSVAVYTDLIRTAAGATHLEMPAVYLFLGLIYYEWNDLVLAEQLLNEAIIIGERTGRGRYWPTIYTALAQVHMIHEDAVQAHVMSEQALMIARSLNNRADCAKAEATQAGLWLKQGNHTALRNWLTQMVQRADPISYQYQGTYLMLARIRIAQEQQQQGAGNLAAVLPILTQLLQLAEIDLRQPDQILILVLISLAQAANGEETQAITTLITALNLAMPERYIRTFIDEGVSIAPLLAACQLRIPAHEARIREYLRILLAELPAATAQSAPAALLSEREQAVLQLLASGQSVQEIATHLIISAHTARTHIKNIYVKLDAHTRVQAVEHARILHLLP